MFFFFNQINYRARFETFLNLLQPKHVIIDVMNHLNVAFYKTNAILFFKQTIIHYFL